MAASIDRESLRDMDYRKLALSFAEPSPASAFNQLVERIKPMLEQCDENR